VLDPDGTRPGATCGSSCGRRSAPDGQATLIGTYVTNGSRPELKDATVKLRPFDWPPYVPTCTKCSNLD
jgi:hypothetical protein